MAFQVIQGDCLEVMRGLPPASVDACITDPPYGTTACAWDSVIPFAPMWAELKRTVKPKGAIVLFGSQPFTSALVMSNPAMFKYEWAWDKVNPTSFLLAGKQPMRAHENILVFYEESPTFNPQKTLKAAGQARTGVGFTHEGEPQNDKGVYGGGLVHCSGYRSEYANPVSLLRVPSGNGWVKRQYVHPTQKPVELLRYLVRTYTNAGDSVLDFTCGSGTTGVACEIEGRNSINIDSDGHYCDVARARITRASGIAADIPRRVKEYPPAPLFEAVAGWAV